MKTLLERAKPELKKAIASFKVDYPSTATRLEETLQKNSVLSDIPYGVVVDLGSVCRSANIKFDMNFPWGQFEDIQ